MVQQPSSVRPDANTRKWLELFLEEIGLQTLGGKAFDWNRVETRGDKVYYLPPVNTGFLRTYLSPQRPVSGRSEKEPF